MNLLQTPPELQLKLETIRVQSLNAHLAFEFEPTDPGQHLQSHMGILRQEIGQSEPPGTPTPAQKESFIFVTKFEFKFYNLPTADIVPAQELEKFPLVATIQAEVAAVYSGKALSTMDPVQRNMWGIRNAVLHQWPYWREICQSTLARMGLPVVVMPLWTPPSKLEVSSRFHVSPAEEAAPAPVAKVKRARKKAT